MHWRLFWLKLLPETEQIADDREYSLASSAMQAVINLRCTNSISREDAVFVILHMLNTSVKQALPDYTIVWAFCALDLKIDEDLLVLDLIDLLIRRGLIEVVLSRDPTLLPTLRWLALTERGKGIADNIKDIKLETPEGELITF